MGGRARSFGFTGGVAEPERLFQVYAFPAAAAPLDARIAQGPEGQWSLADVASSQGDATSCPAGQLQADLPALPPLIGISALLPRRWVPLRSEHFAAEEPVGDVSRNAMAATRRGRGFLRQVEFPEVQSALQRFMSVMNSAWNISLFHYRQSGNRSSTILLGLQARLACPYAADS